MINKVLLKEGKGYFYISLFLFLLFLIIDCDFLAFISFLALVSIIIVFRNNLPKKAPIDSLISPLTGKIYAMDKKENSTILYIDVCLFSNSAIVAMKDCDYVNHSIRHGLNLNAKTYKALLLNTKRIINFDDIALEFISGRFDIKCDFDGSKKIKQYDQVGVFIDGIVKIIVPNSYNITSKIGDKITIGKAI